MQNALQITSFQICGMEQCAAVETPDVCVSLYTEGAPEGMCFRLFDHQDILWFSGELPWTPQTVLTALPLKPNSSYRLEAQVTKNGTSVFSQISLNTGFMGSHWQAKWIEPQQENGIRERSIQFFELFMPQKDHYGGHDRLRPVQELKRDFTLPEKPERATLYATAHGVYALWLNGQRVSEQRLAPETTDYPNLLYYQVYDLSHMIREGKNTLRVLLGDGWWIGRIGLSGDSCQYGDRLGFLGQLELTGKDGMVETISTDSSFLSRPSFIRYSDLFMGEKWDLTLPEQPWTPCIEQDFPTENLKVQPIAPIGVWKQLSPAEILTTPKGELVVDFGQCLAGVVKLRVSCPPGRVIMLDHSETLDQEGNFFRNILGRNKDQQDVVVCGQGETTFCPEFTYHGFRYVRIVGASPEEILSVGACVIGTPLQKTGRFACSDSRLNQLQHNILWATRSNMVSVPTDCPQREKQGWTGDIQVFASTGCFNFDLTGFLRAWLAQMRLAQTEDGGIPIVVPSFPAQTAMQIGMSGSNTSSAWSDACVLVPLRLFEETGDREILRENLPMMRCWLGYIQEATKVLPEDYARRDQAGKDRCRFLWTGGYHFGDWLIPSFEDDIPGGTAATARVVAACQYAITVEAYLETLRALDAHAAERKEYEDLLRNIRSAIREEFVHEDGTLDADLQGPYVMVLRSGAVEGALADRVAARLVQRIHENGGGLDTGFVSVPYLLDMLTKYGYREEAWKQLFRRESPSWLYQVEHGATSMWENWNAIRPDGTVTTSSFNHYALGCVGSWMYRQIGGIQCAKAGWKEILFAPATDCGLRWADCSHQTPYGRAACRWEKNDKETRIEITVPEGVNARVSLPGLNMPLSPGTHNFTV